MTEVVLEPDQFKLDLPVTEEYIPIEERGKSIPQAVGYKIVCAIPRAERTFGDGTIIKADSTIRDEEIGTVTLFVVDIGPDAYQDKSKFPTGAWCKKGDFVLVRTYAGTRLKVFGQEFRIISDDMVEAVVEDPRGIRRIGG